MDSFPTIVCTGDTEKPFALILNEDGTRVPLEVPQLLHIVQSAAEAVQHHANELGWQNVMTNHETIFPGSTLDG